MNYAFTHTLHKILLIAGVMILASVKPVSAFNTDTYTDQSVLATGKWVAVDVAESGLQLIPSETLRAMGFSDPSKVVVYGYGAPRITDHLSLANYRDDLPQVGSVSTSRGLVFYGSGPVNWSTGSQSRMLHTRNPFAVAGRYFLTEQPDGASPISVEETLPISGSDMAKSFTQPLLHETEEMSAGESGHDLLGEDLRYTPSRSFTFSLPDRVAGENAWVQVRSVANVSSAATIDYTVNNTPVEGKYQIYATGPHAYGTRGLHNFSVADPGDRLTLGLKFTPSGTVSLARLDYIIVNYQRELRMPSSGAIEFTLPTSEASLANATASTRVWDITDPVNPVEISTVMSGNNATWHSPYGPNRRYVAWNPDATLPRPETVGEIANQNLHDPSHQPDMVIFTPSAWKAQAERIAALHRNDPVEALDVMVVEVEKVYNEFSSGAADVSAMRRMLKMIYDRGNQSGHPLRYALLLGRATYDNRNLTREFSALRHTYLPTWQSDESLSEFDSFCSDDILAFLDDNSGLRPSSDRHCIAIGRIPASSLASLTSYVNKLENYLSPGYQDDAVWKNRVLLVADDGNAGRHTEHSETLEANFRSTDGGKRMTYTKAYIDAFPLVGGSCEGARERMHRSLSEGVMWWNYIGHAGRNFLTGDNMLTFKDLSALYLKRLPVFCGFTCSFARWDGIDPSGSEIMVMSESGGVIAALTATREVMIEDNGYLSAALGLEAFQPGENGLLPTLGEIMMKAKNRLASPYGSSNSNKLRYVTVGDPAMRLAAPSLKLTVETINGEKVPQNDDPSQADFPEIMARQNVVVAGHVSSPDGSQLDSFNGLINARLYDAEYSTTTTGRKTALDGEGKQITFEEQGSLLYAGRDSVAGGRFAIHIPMPAEVADNYRPAAISLYAASSDGREAIGCNRNFYVYGFDESAEADTSSPVVEYAYLNHSSFKNGDVVNPSPMFIAGVSDNVGINLSAAGVGHQMTLKLDNSTTYSDLSLYYTPSGSSTPGGTLAYPLTDISAGRHTLTFKVWDTSGNSTSTSLDFVVDPYQAPKMFDVYTDANPASVETNFYVRHNRPNANVTVTIAVYNLLGHMVWTSTVTDRSDYLASTPINWNLHDMGGRRVNRGIYIYRVTMSDANSSAKGAVSGRIAVAAP
ncbi:MAG: type IX secretion system sortase PorU [Paramuribaculum sp.]|nr:type IX secretion system sortase PorU [Paramuribaculum sp.]MDE6304056.1 type IX secretion system sortase PorU [Paramuribaculum sp.]